MEMKGIDLTKCSNCRAWVRYRYDRVYEDTGRIEKVTEGGEVWMRFVADKDGELVTMWEDGKICEYIMDFEIIPRDPETYRDWQVGDKVLNYNIRLAKDAAKEVIFRSGEVVMCKTMQNSIAGVYTCDELYQAGYRLVLTDIEQQIIGEKKKYEPQDGDVCFVRTDAGNCFVFIKRDNEAEYTINCYASFATNEHDLFLNQVSCVCDRKSIRELRPATDEEKQLLFDAMAKNGKCWNARKKVVEDIPKPYEFRKGEPVLVRSDRTHRWQLRVISLSVYGNPPKVEVTDGCDEWIYWIDKDEVIPYNEKTMHLLGTSEDYKEE